MTGSYWDYLAKRVSVNRNPDGNSTVLEENSETEKLLALVKPEEVVGGAASNSVLLGI